ncbi:hypothetical protein chiPu_0002247 [Chiloscyllium punctatum]|uniref:Rho-GAP domain-containing protein n=1 Tax=Chiloscyllium punctatum TaxID=137246 RepID=A0A401S0D7_CHIPU|nr:hypothetical protein [Chiloscyllium punctatum]
MNECNKCVAGDQLKRDNSIHPVSNCGHFSPTEYHNYSQRVQCVKELVKKLPKPNHDTLRVLVKHLQKIIAKALVNLMSSQSLGIVFGPTLMWPENESSNMAVLMTYQNQIIDLILTEHTEIFGP